MPQSDPPGHFQSPLRFLDPAVTRTSRGAPAFVLPVPIRKANRLASTMRVAARFQWNGCWRLPARRARRSARIIRTDDHQPIVADLLAHIHWLERHAGTAQLPNGTAAGPAAYVAMILEIVLMRGVPLKIADAPSSQPASKPSPACQPPPLRSTAS